MQKVLNQLLASQEVVSLVLNIGEGHQITDVRITGLDEESGIVTLINEDDGSTGYIRLADIAIVVVPKNETPK